MKRLALLFFVVIATIGCTVSGSGSQAISVDTDAIGTGRSAFVPADGDGFHNGEKLDQRY